MKSITIISIFSNDWINKKESQSHIECDVYIHNKLRTYYTTRGKEMTTKEMQLKQ